MAVVPVCQDDANLYSTTPRVESLHAKLRKQVYGTHRSYQCPDVLIFGITICDKIFKIRGMMWPRYSCYGDRKIQVPTVNTKTELSTLNFSLFI